MPKHMEHHKQADLCTSRPAYRQGRKLTAVKVYTVNSESMHLLIFGVPKINLRTELKNLCQKYGDLGVMAVTNDYEVELFTECFHVSYQRIQSARIAKKVLDDRSFYGGILHVCYAPEFETIEETRAKLLQRRKDVFFKTKTNSNMQYQEIAKGTVHSGYSQEDEDDPGTEINDYVTLEPHEDDPNMTTTSYNIKVITVQNDTDEPGDENNITRIEVTSTQPAQKRKIVDESAETSDEDYQPSQDFTIKKKIINLDQTQPRKVNRIVYRKQ